MTKNAIKKALEEGAMLEEILEFRAGQECDIFKTEFNPSMPDEVCYIPDIYLNEIKAWEKNLTDEEIEELLSDCYTVQDIIDVCEGNVTMAERVFNYIDWQHPSTGFDELSMDDEEEEE